jgi:CBS domain-containing protein
MKTVQKFVPPPRPPTLRVKTAEELMTPNPVSIREDATVREAVALLIDKGFSAAPVIDEAGRPVGVLSRADVLVHDRESVRYLEAHAEYYDKADLMLGSGETLREGFQVERPDDVQVGEIMTPVVFAVTPDTPARGVIEEMLGYRVHRMFVVDDSGVLVGVISALDVLRALS